MVVKIHFEHPETSIMLVGEWDDRGETVVFDFEDFDLAAEKNTQNDIEEVREWCIQSAINCYDVHQANRHLTYLGINERFK